MTLFWLSPRLKAALGMTLIVPVFWWVGICLHFNQAFLRIRADFAQHALINGLLAIGVLLFFVSRGILKAQTWVSHAIKWLTIVGFLFLVAALYFGNKEMAPAFGFFALFWIAFGLLWRATYQSALGASYMDAQVAWFEGKPAKIPMTEVKIELTQGQTIELEINRLEESGLFGFLDKKTRLSADLGKKRLKAWIDFRGNQTLCHVRLVRMIRSDEESSGLGFIFWPKVSDEKKRVLDLIQLLRSEGYV